MRWISRVGASGPPMSRCTTSSPNESRHFLVERTIDNSFIRKVAPGFWKHKIRNSWGRRFLSYIYHDHHDHSIYTGCLGGICRWLSSHDWQRCFLMKEVVLSAVSFYLLKQDVQRVSGSTDL